MRGLVGGGGGGEGAGLKKISSQLQNSFKGTTFVPLKFTNCHLKMVFLDFQRMASLQPYLFSHVLST